MAAFEQLTGVAPLPANHKEQHWHQTKQQRPSSKDLEHIRQVIAERNHLDMILYEVAVERLHNLVGGGQQGEKQTKG